MTKPDPQLRVRLPADLRQKVEAQAEIHGRSINAELVEIIRAGTHGGGSGKEKEIMALQAALIENRERQVENLEVALCFNSFTLLMTAKLISDDESLSPYHRALAFSMTELLSQLAAIYSFDRISPGAQALLRKMMNTPSGKAAFSGLIPDDAE